MQYESQIDLIMEKLYKKGFSFRDSQLETIIKIADSGINNPEKSLIIDAPTGTGKSILSIVSSLLLNEHNKTGYILTSDLGLQTQYENDIFDMRFHIPSVRGIDNYECIINMQTVSLGECRTKNVPKQSLPCYTDCPYFSQRDRASFAKTSLLNYSYWLLQMNYVKNDTLFSKRDFCFFDEAHKIQDIVQGHFSPKINNRIVDNIEAYTGAFDYMSDIISDVPKMLQTTSNIIKSIYKETDSEKLLDHLKNLDRTLKLISSSKEAFKKYCGSKWNYGVSVPNYILKAQSALDRISDTHCKIEDYIINLHDINDLVKIKDDQENVTSFKNLDESGLINNTLISKAGFKVFMSATIGNPDTYAKFIGLENYESIEICNKFQLEKSPIFYFKGYKLNYANREKNFPNVLKINDNIIKYHEEHKGIIHSSSFSLTKQIQENSKYGDRLISYNSSKEKDDAIEKFKESKNGILIGPSLLEGLSFDDDLSRFQIFFKIPFPNISDEFMKKLLEVYPEKYSVKTVNNIIQGTGRSIRNKDDWAITYIIDSCFDQFLSGKFLSKSFINRLKIKNIK